MPDAKSSAPVLVRGTQADYARHIGKSRSYVNKLVKQGRITLDAQRLVSFAEADFNLGLVADPARQDPQPVRPPPPDDPPGGELPLETSLFAKTKNQQALYDLGIKRLSYERQLGKLLPRDVVLAAVEDASRIVVQAMSGLLACAPELFMAGQSGGEEAVRACLKERLLAVQKKAQAELETAASPAGEEEVVE